jgi:hypothetical protein
MLYTVALEPKYWKRLILHRPKNFFLLHTRIILPILVVMPLAYPIFSSYYLLSTIFRSLRVLYDPEEILHIGKTDTVVKTLFRGNLF